MSSRERQRSKKCEVKLFNLSVKRKREKELLTRKERNKKDLCLEYKRGETKRETREREKPKQQEGEKKTSKKRKKKKEKS